MSVQETTLVTERRKHVRPEASETSEERGLVAQAKSGSPSAFGQLYERYRLMVYHTTFRVLGRKIESLASTVHLANDALQLLISSGNR